MEIGRFAPTPSGRMHLGNLFSGLLAWLSARSAGGEMLLRIEDLDTPRCPPENAELMRSDLRWLGLDWDREQIPQRERTAAYEAAIAALEEAGHVFPCWCSRSDLNSVPNAPHASDGHAIYPGTCRNLTAEKRAEKASQRLPLQRLAVPDEIISFTDGHYGHYEENLARECGDFVLRRADGVFSYQLAVVVDDIAGGITQVVRGQDLLSSTPRQLYLYRLLNASPPRFYHLPLLTAADGRRLSKRDRDLDMGLLRQRYAPEELVGVLAHAAGLLDIPDPCTPRELLPLFDWNRIPKTNLPVTLPISGDN